MKIFNPERKEKYLSIKNTEAYKTSLRWLFSKSYEFEEEYSKDISEFDLEQLKRFFSKRRFNPHTLNVYLSMVEDYVSWSMSEGIIGNRPYKLTRKVKDEFIDEIALPPKEYLSFEEVEEIAGIKNHGYNFPPLKNKQDSLLVYLSFLGAVGPRLSYLTNLKITDVNMDESYIIVGEDKQRIYLNPQAMTMIQEAHKEKRYWKYDVDMTGFRGKDYSPLIDSDYIFKKSNIGNADPSTPMAEVSIRRRLVSIREYIGDFMDFDTLEKSGMLYLAKLVYDRDKYLDRDNLKLVFDRYRVGKSNLSRYNSFSFVKEQLPKVYEGYEIN